MEEAESVCLNMANIVSKNLERKFFKLTFMVTVQIVIYFMVGSQLLFKIFLLVLIHTGITLLLCRDLNSRPAAGTARYPLSYPTTQTDLLHFSGSPISPYAHL